MELELDCVAHFQLIGELGRGGMGIVYEAHDMMLGRRVALKLRRRDASLAQVGRDRLTREARALSRVSHPNVVRIYGADVAAPEPYIAMELVEGPTLQRWLYEVRDWRSIIDVFVRVGRGLARVHEVGLVHRDVKPSNIFIDRDGTPKLGDFGLVIDADDDDDAVGTPAYMAPEQRLGHRADPRADQFAFCVSLYEALIGGLPSSGLSSFGLPRRVQPILERGLADAPEQRWPTMTALLRELAAVRRGPVQRIAAKIARVAA